MTVVRTKVQTRMVYHCNSPLIGRVTDSVTKRNARTAGEWMAAAYDGESMCFAWLCGRALSQIIASGDTNANSDWFP